MGSLLRNYRINTADLLSNKFVEFLVESNPTKIRRNHEVISLPAYYHKRNQRVHSLGRSELI